ncbi:hypothetical protein A9CBEGH2_19620 [Amedibacterium intestinale]|uniref:PepSY domain-containing protein n=1 Tax=Amedibacterium intestinale TaxID=2583452 RepID=UPI001373D4DC|nr:PepSY domain-containing protein [Amedibacterium intestinale]BBK63022.1 hypothetical protein A9CBEGH2_19620 [Amedibacterium intestinale]
MKKLYKLCYPLLAVAILAGCSNGMANTASDGSYISEDSAKTTAYNHANVNEKDVASIQLTKDKENGKDVYSIEFYTKDKKYDYDIDRSTGEILKNESENLTSAMNNEKNTDSKKNNTSTTVNTTSNSNNKTTASNTPSNNTNKSSSSNKTPASSSITKEKAKSIAFAHAKVSESNVKGLKIENDWEHGQEAYSVSFYTGNYEYEYDIAKSNGTILKADKDYEKNNNSSNSNSMISKDKAMSIALAKVSGATSSNIYIELEKDDGRYTYEGEINFNNKEYEFEIDAYTGNILKWEVDSFD